MCRHERMRFRGAEISSIFQYTHSDYENLIEYIKQEMNERGTQLLNAKELGYFKRRSGKSFCKLFGHEKVFPASQTVLGDIEAEDLPIEGVAGRKITNEIVQGFLR